MLTPEIYNQIKSTFDRYGVPAAVWYPIMMMESGGNPDAIGDNGDSVGLFQLNIRAGQGFGWDKTYLMHPIHNAEIAAPSIAAAFKAIADTVPRERWAAETAIRSGHPGGSIEKPLLTPAGRAAQERLNRLQAQFDQGAQIGGDIPGFSGVQNAATNINAMQTWIDDLMRMDWQDIGIRAILGVAGVILIFIVILFVVRDSEAGKQFIEITKQAASK